MIKDQIGKYAASIVEDGMLVGLGTGSTANCFIEHLGYRVKKGLKIQAVASSFRSEKKAEEFNIPLISMNKISSVDLAFDGADQIDPQKRMIKGKGGALLREKILASISRKVYILVDDSKLVPQLGKEFLPLEVAEFGAFSTEKKLLSLGYDAKIRMMDNHCPFITDNGNFLIDIYYDKRISSPEEEDDELKKVIGVLDTGFFFNLAQKVIVGYSEKRIELLD